MKRREHESTGELGRRATYLCTCSSSCERARPHDTYVVYMHVHVEPLPGLPKPSYWAWVAQAKALHVHVHYVVTSYASYSPRAPES